MPERHELPRWTAVASQPIQRPLSPRSKRWIYSLAKIKFQIDRAIQVETDHILEADEIASKPFPFPGREDEYRHWSTDIKHRASLPRPVTEDESLAFITDNRSLWAWQAVYHSFLPRPSRHIDPDNIAYRKNLSAPFTNMALHLWGNCMAVNYDELDLLSDVIDAVDLQLNMLSIFGELYGQECVGEGRIVQEPVPWRGDLRRKIHSEEKIKRESERDEAKLTKFARPPAQHAQDNLLLQTMIGCALLASVYPLYRAMGASQTLGSVSDADFWQQVINAIIQLAGFVTLLVPIYRETGAKEWVGTWILTGLGVCSTVASIPLYIYAPGLLSVFFSWLASATQLLVVLQVALVAAFQTQRHVKKE